MKPSNVPLVTTIKERCRVCYTCVRECPAKAIRIVEQQAEVMPERCIGCGNCVRVCSQHAKRVTSDLEHVQALLKGGDPVAAILAPSFPAEFVDIEYQIFVGMLRSLGFELVNEVGFGADLVAAKYRHLLERNPDRRYIATTCPAIIGYVERYHPELVPFLAPVVSPMLATARMLRQRHGDNLRIVFIGPCIAKKGEATSDPVVGEVDAVMTFVELGLLFEMANVSPARVEPSDFDPPHGAYGGLFPISRGMLQAANLEEDLVTGEVIAADGHQEFVDAIREFELGDVDIQLLECLCCNGCIMGPGISSETPLFRRRAQVSRYVRQRMHHVSRAEWKRNLAKYMKCDLTREFLANDQRIDKPSQEAIQQILRQMGKTKAEDELNCGACGYDTCREHAIAIY
ncbi:MAG: 4Fe-4S binding protein, partial [Xanthomonadaceae bacterium]|nr:4Fe-4S binding protein [Xanthomonadaceae bacterium]